MSSSSSTRSSTARMIFRPKRDHTGDPARSERRRLRLRFRGGGFARPTCVGAFGDGAATGTAFNCRSGAPHAPQLRTRFGPSGACNMVRAPQ